MADAKRPASKYARKLEWRRKNCGSNKAGAIPLPFFPEVMALPPSQKPWGA